MYGSKKERQSECVSRIGNRFFEDYWDFWIKTKLKRIIKFSVTTWPNFRHWLGDPEDVCALTSSGAVSQVRDAIRREIWVPKLDSGEGAGWHPTYPRLELSLDIFVWFLRQYVCSHATALKQTVPFVYNYSMERARVYLHLLWYQITKSQCHKTEDPLCLFAGELAKGANFKLYCQHKHFD